MRTSCSIEDAMMDDLLYRFSEARLENLSHIMEVELKKIFLMETYMAPCLKKMLEIAGLAELHDLLGQYGADVQMHVRRLEKVLSIISVSLPDANKASGNNIIALLIDDALKTAGAIKDDPFCSDRVVVLEVQKLLHVKISSYMALSGWAKTLRLYGISEILEDCLDDVINTDLSLSELAEAASDQG